MSEYFDVRCKDCDDAVDAGNRAKQNVHAIASNWPAIRGIMTLEQRIPELLFELRWTGVTSDVVHFLLEHESHRLTIHSEYPDRDIDALVLAPCSPHIINSVTRFCRVCGASAESIIRTQETR